MRVHFSYQLPSLHQLIQTLFFLFLILIFITPAYGIVNIEDINTMKAEPGWKGKIDLSAQHTTGNTELSRFSWGSQVLWDHNGHQEMLIYNQEYGTSLGQTNINNLMGHLRHTTELSQLMAWEGFLQAEKDEFTRLSFRSLVGSNLRFHFLDGEKLKLDAGQGLFYSIENLEETPTTTDGGREYLWRLNTYLSTKVGIQEGVTLGNTTYFQPVPTEPEDFQLLNQLSLNLALTKYFGIQLSWNLSHDNQPPQLIEKTDSSFYTSVNFRF